MRRVRTGGNFDLVSLLPAAGQPVSLAGVRYLAAGVAGRTSRTLRRILVALFSRTFSGKSVALSRVKPESLPSIAVISQPPAAAQETDGSRF